jgi:hypothetical protein
MASEGRGTCGVTTAPLLDLQHCVQRRLGRNLMRLQQYERLLKQLIVVSEISGVPSELQTNLERRRELFANKTLGHLVGELTGELLGTSERNTEAQESRAEREVLAQNQPFFRTTFFMHVAQQDYEQIRQELAQLVGMRNELVHHFHERFDLRDAGQCVAAETYLDEGLSQVDSHWQRLVAWAESHDAARQMMAAFMQTPEFENLLLYGVSPDGSVDWASAPVIGLLKAAEEKLGRDGWTALDEVIAQLRKTHPEHTPKRYGCKTWRQLIRRSEFFELKRQAELGKTWYRSLPDATSGKQTLDPNSGSLDER